MAFNLAFYYHVPIISENDNLFCPGYLGVFIDALAQEVDELVLLMYENDFVQSSDYRLQQQNISFVSLGKKQPAWKTFFSSKFILEDSINKINHCDTLLVRAPSPLAPFFKKHLKTTKLAYLVVGDYQEVAKTIKFSSLRSLLVKYFLFTNNFLLKRQLKKNLVVVNSQALYEKYQNSCNNIYLVNTTTLCDRDFYFRENTCEDERIDILFTGNDYGTEVFNGIHDAGTGMVLLNQVNRNFKALPPAKTHFYNEGNTRGLVKYYDVLARQFIYLTNRHGDTPILQNAVKELDNRKLITIPKNVHRIKIQYPDGEKIVQELYIGQGYKSQNSRKIYVQGDVQRITGTTFKGKEVIIFE